MTYQVENIAHNAKTRTHRAKAAGANRCKLYIAGQRVVPERKISISEVQFKAEANSLLKMVLEGRIALYTPDQMKITSLPTGELIVLRLTDGAIKMLPLGVSPPCFSVAPTIEAKSPVAEPTKAEVVLAVPAIVDFQPSMEVEAPVLSTAEETPAVEEEAQEEPVEKVRRKRR